MKIIDEIPDYLDHEIDEMTYKALDVINDKSPIVQCGVAINVLSIVLTSSFLNKKNKDVDEELKDVLEAIKSCIEFYILACQTKEALKAIDACVAENKGKDEEEISPF